MKKELIDEAEKAYNVLETLSVSGDAVDRMFFIRTCMSNLIRALKQLPEDGDPNA